MECIQHAVLYSDSSVGLSSEEKILALYDLYGTNVLRLCYLCLGSRTQAEEAAQQVFLKLWKQLDHGTFLRHTSMQVLVMRTAIKVCRMHARIQQNTSRLAQPCFFSESTEDTLFLTSVMQLPERYRSLLLLVYWQRMSLSDTAAVLRIRPLTLLRRLETARDLLRKSSEERR